MQLLWLQAATTDFQQAVEDQAAAQVLCSGCTSPRMCEFRVAVGDSQQGPWCSFGALSPFSVTEPVITEHH